MANSAQTYEQVKPLIIWPMVDLKLWVLSTEKQKALKLALTCFLIPYRMDSFRKNVNVYLNLLF